MLGNCTAPILTEDRLSKALNHENENICSFAKIVKHFKEVGNVAKNELPSMPLILNIEKQIDSLQGEDRDSAFHIIWYIKELSLGRIPKL